MIVIMDVLRFTVLAFSLDSLFSLFLVYYIF